MKNILIFSTLLIASLAFAEDAAPSFSFTIKDVPKDKAELERFLANFKANVLPKISTLHSCVQSTRILAETYRDIKDEMFGLQLSGNKLLLEADFSKPLDYPYDRNLLKNFKLLQTTQKTALTAIEGFHNEMKIAQDAPMEEVKAKIEKLNVKVALLSDSLVKNAISEDAFLYVLNTAVDNLSNIALDSQRDLEFIVSPDCSDVPSQSLGAFLRKDFDEMGANVSEMRDYVSAARQKRSKLLTYLVQYHRYKLTARYTEITNKDLVEIRDTMIDVLAAGELLTEFHNWAFKNTINGAGDSLDTLYLQFEEPLRILRSRIEGARAYIVRFEAIKNAPESMKAILKSQVQNQISAFESQLATLEAKGWSGQLTRQIYAVEFLEKTDKPLPDDCRPALAAYRKLTVTSIEQFRVAEDRFFDVRDLCNTNRVKR
jgi:hypothetical protein